MKCQRCKQSLEKEAFCQSCKSILLPYFENSGDWQIALELESLQRSVNLYINTESDLSDNANY